MALPPTPFAFQISKLVFSPALAARPPSRPRDGRPRSLLRAQRLPDEGGDLVRVGHELRVGLLGDVLVREGAAGADLDAGRVAVAQVALQDRARQRVGEGGAERTGEGTREAADAAGLVDLHRAGGEVPVRGVLGADHLTGRLLAAAALDGDEDGVPLPLHHVDPALGGIAGALVLQGAVALAGAAPGALLG